MHPQYFQNKIQNPYRNKTLHRVSLSHLPRHMGVFLPFSETWVFIAYAQGYFFCFGQKHCFSYCPLLSNFNSSLRSQLNVAFPEEDFLPFRFGRASCEEGLSLHTVSRFLHLNLVFQYIQFNLVFKILSQSYFWVDSELFMLSVDWDLFHGLQSCWSIDGTTHYSN